MNKAETTLMLIFWIWVLIPIFFFPQLFLIIGVVLTIVWLASVVKSKRSTKKWNLFLLLSPVTVLFFCGFFNGVINYFQGTATFLFHSEKNLIALDSYQDFDHKYRVYYHDFGGKFYGPINGISLARMYAGKVNDILIKTLTNTLGYQNHMYQGEIPSPDKIYNALMTSPLDTIFLKAASPQNAAFNYNGKEYNIKNATRKSRDIDSPILCYNGNCLTDERIPLGDGKSLIGGKILAEGAFFVASNYFHPLLLVVDEANVAYNECIEVWLVDLELEQMFASYSIEGSKRYNCTFCYCD